MAKVTGMDNVLQNLSKEIRRIEGATEKGTLKAALLIRRKSMQLVPVRLGNLRASAYVVSSSFLVDPSAKGGNFKGDSAGDMASQHAQEVARVAAVCMKKGKRKMPTSAVAYSAVYAQSVHETPSAGAAGATEADDVARAPSSKVPLSQIHSKKGQWKFLEQPLKDNAGKIIEIIKREAKT